MICTHPRFCIEPTDQELDEIDFVVIADVIDIVRGINTPNLQKHGKLKLINKYLSLLSNECNLDIEASSDSTAFFLWSRLCLMIMDQQKNLDWVKRYYDLKRKKDTKSSNGTCLDMLMRSD